MDENVLAIFPLDESKAFCGVKPLQYLFLSCFLYFILRWFSQDLRTSQLRGFPGPEAGPDPSTGAEPGAVRAI